MANKPEGGSGADGVPTLDQGLGNLGGTFDSAKDAFDVIERGKKDLAIDHEREEKKSEHADGHERPESGKGDVRPVEPHGPDHEAHEPHEPHEHEVHEHEVHEHEAPERDHEPRVHEPHDRPDRPDK